MCFLILIWKTLWEKNHGEIYLQPTFDWTKQHFIECRSMLVIRDLILGRVVLSLSLSYEQKNINQHKKKIDLAKLYSLWFKGRTNSASRDLRSHQPIRQSAAVVWFFFSYGGFRFRHEWSTVPKYEQFSIVFCFAFSAKFFSLFLQFAGEHSNSFIATGCLLY